MSWNKIYIAWHWKMCLKEMLNVLNTFSHSIFKNVIRVLWYYILLTALCNRHKPVFKRQSPEPIWILKHQFGSSLFKSYWYVGKKALKNAITHCIIKWSYIAILNKMIIYDFVFFPRGSYIIYDPKTEWKKEKLCRPKNLRKTKTWLAIKGSSPFL